MGRGVGNFDPAALRTVRLRRRMTMRQLGALIGVSAQQINAYEKGRSPEPARLAKLAEALSVPTHWLMGETIRDSQVPLADLRRRAGLTSAQVAKTIGVSRSTYQRLERDGAVPKTWPHIVGHLADLLNVHPSQLEQVVHSARLSDEREAKAEQAAAEFARLACDRDWTIAVSRGDPRLQQLAAAVGYPQDRVRETLLAELRSIRSLARRLAGAEAQSAWAGDNDAADPAESARFMLEGACNRLVGNLRSSLRLLTRKQLSFLTYVYLRAPGKIYVVSPAQSSIKTLLSMSFVAASSPGPARGSEPVPYQAIQITKRGELHLRRYRREYLRLYPDVAIPQPERLAYGETWRRADESSAHRANAVEVGKLDKGGVLVRDARNPNGAKLVFNYEAWADFVGGVQRGEFDLQPEEP